MKTRLRRFEVVFSVIVMASILRVAMASYPNIEPVMLFTLTTALTLGPTAGAVTGAGTMFMSNILMMGGPYTYPWITYLPLTTLYTSAAYGLVGVLAGLAGIFWRNWSRLQMSILAASLTIIYDAVTCICFALQFYGPGGIPTAAVMQIPFTILHLSNALIVYVFAPTLYKMIKHFTEETFKVNTAADYSP